MTMIQGSLFNLGHPDMPPSQRHSDTSVAAAESVRPAASRLRSEVLAFIAGCDDGATDEEGIAAMAMNPSTYRPRRIECVADGSVVDSGEKRATKSGRLATVWVAKKKNKEA